MILIFRLNIDELWPVCNKVQFSYYGIKVLCSCIYVLNCQLNGISIIILIKRNCLYIIGILKANAFSTSVRKSECNNIRSAILSVYTFVVMGPNINLKFFQCIGIVEVKFYIFTNAISAIILCQVYFEVSIIHFFRTMLAQIVPRIYRGSRRTRNNVTKPK